MMEQICIPECSSYVFDLIPNSIDENTPKNLYTCSHILLSSTLGAHVHNKKSLNSVFCKTFYTTSALHFCRKWFLWSIMFCKSISEKPLTRMINKQVLRFGPLKEMAFSHCSSDADSVVAISLFSISFCPFLLYLQFGKLSLLECPF